MLRACFVVYDSCAEVFSTPIFAMNRGDAIRAFTDACNDKTHMYNKHPYHYTLFYLGSYDLRSAELKIEKAPIVVIKAIECVRTTTDEQIEMFEKGGSDG